MLALIALRNLSRNRRRTLLSLLVVSSGTAYAGCQSFQPPFHTGAFGGIMPDASAARSSSSRTSRCCPAGSAQRHATSLLT